MKEKPILFSGPMIRAILSGRKTQTRRIVKADLDDDQPHTIRDNGYVWSARMYQQWTKGGKALKCPYGITSEKLWVRETFAYNVMLPASMHTGPGSLHFAATCEEGRLESEKWRPSIHMPRWASRITLEITNVRIERLHAITAKDILAEGVVERSHEVEGLGKFPVSAINGACYPDLRSLWVAAWIKINGEKSWRSNPYVWVIEFKRVAP